MSILYTRWTPLSGVTSSSWWKLKNGGNVSGLADKLWDCRPFSWVRYRIRVSGRPDTCPLGWESTRNAPETPIRVRETGFRTVYTYLGGPDTDQKHPRFAAIVTVGVGLYPSAFRGRFSGRADSIGSRERVGGNKTRFYIAAVQRPETDRTPGYSFTAVNVGMVRVTAE